MVVAFSVYNLLSFSMTCEAQYGKLTLAELTGVGGEGGTGVIDLTAGQNWIDAGDKPW